jgi:tetratricopeptide (TPR) repeat protein
MATAQRALEQNEVQIAESSYRSVLLEGWLLLGALAVEAGDLEAAKAAFELASVSAVETRRPRMSLALVEIQLGNPQTAVSLLRGLKKDDLSDAVVRRLIPRALMAADQVEEAIQEMEELHVLTPGDLENTYALARAYLGQARLEEAAPLFEELAERRPMAETQVLVGRTYRDFDHYERAREALLAALELDPQVARAHYYLGSIDLLDQGQDALEKAMEHFEAELRVAPEDPLTNLYLGIALVETRRHEEALPRLELASRMVTGRAGAFQFLGRGYLALDRTEEAVAAFRRGLQIAENAPEQVVARGAVDFRRRQISSLHFQLAQALRRRGENEEARIHFDAAKQFSARSAEGARDLLEAYFREEEGDRNIAGSTWPLELMPVSGFDPEQRAGVDRAVEAALVQAYFNLGFLRTKAGEYVQAAALYSQAVELDPDFPRLQFSLGAALFNSEQYEKATAPLSLALAEAPNDQNLQRMLALAWFNSEAYDQAADLLRDDPERSANPSLQYAYAVSLVRSGRATEAEPVFSRLLAENADWPELNVLLGQAHAQENDYDEAIRYLRRALELKADVAEAQETLGDIFLRQGKLPEAEEALRAELRSHPDSVRARYTLAVVLDLNRKPQEAVELLRPLLKARPDLADGRYLLGKILLAQGATEEARSQLEAAAELSPGDANTHYQLGQVYQRLGRREDARRAFDEYRRLKKEGREGTES